MPFYKKVNTILDIGTGNGALALLLEKEGKKITGLDIKNKSAFPSIVPLIYDGQLFPFEDNAFEVVQLITMLHHTPEPELLIREAKRVGQQIIIMEDIYDNSIQKYFTFFADSLNNLEFSGHPHSNKTDAAWKKIFEESHLELKEVAYYDFLFFFRQVTYVLEK